MICAIFDLQVVSYSIKNNNAQICKSERCKKTADEIISAMNQTMDPCENFFKYACGNWHSGMSHKSHFHILNNRTNLRVKEIFESPWTPQDSSALTKAKKIYKACMDEDSIEKRGVRDLVNLIDGISGWPIAMTLSEWSYKNKSWQEVDKSFRELIGNSPLFSLKVMEDVKNSTNHIIQLSPPLDGIAEYISRQAAALFPLNVILNLPNVMNYQNIVANVGRIFASNRGVIIQERDIEEDAKDIVNFEWNLKLIILSSSSNSSNGEVDSIYQKMMISDFQKFYESSVPENSTTRINWYDLIANLFVGVPGVTIKQSEVVVIINKDYFVNLADLIRRTPVRVVVNTMHWWLIRSFGFFTNQQMNNLIKDVLPGGLTSVSNKNSKLTPRWLICTRQNEMMHAFSYAYVQKHLPKRSQEAAEMIHEIINGMREEIENSKWLDDYSKRGALEKVQAMREFIGFPRWYNDINSVDNYYKSVVPSKFYFRNVLMMLKFRAKEELKLLRERVSDQIWIGSPIDINAFYYYPSNAITIPAGILQVPFFEDEHPDALNYGALGSIIGHEISHGFDDVGRQFDKNGNIRNWWSNATISEYRKRAQCFIDKFNNMSITYNNTIYRVNSRKTLSENIADSTGVKAVFEAFKVHNKKSSTPDVKLPGLEHLNENELFFLSYTHSFCSNLPINSLMYQLRNDNHSPAAVRIEGTLSNIEGFAETYNCPLGSRMNPHDKCSIW
ncbi:Similar to Nep1: Neprilysin-1 (Drosophila melanogaster), partial [Cotesia congregata]